MASAFAIIEGLMPESKMEAVPVREADAGSTYESVPCNLCGSEDLETIYGPRQDLERDPALADKFRASSDELLTQPLVRCRRCCLQFVNPRVSRSAMLDGYASGDDPAYVSQMPSRVRTFARMIPHLDRLRPGKGPLLDVGTAAGAFLKAAKTTAGRRPASSPTPGSPTGGAGIRRDDSRRVDR